MVGKRCCLFMLEMKHRIINGAKIFLAEATKLKKNGYIHTYPQRQYFMKSQHLLTLTDNNEKYQVGLKFFAKFLIKQIKTQLTVWENSKSPLMKWDQSLGSNT